MSTREPSAKASDSQRLDAWRPRLEALARAQGLDFDPVVSELVPDSFMMEVAVYGLPVRMPHWSFGVRYIHQYVQHRMGHSHIFEVVFPGVPNRAYLQQSNALAENVLVTAHVLGHADFSRHNALFQRMQGQSGTRVVELAAARARRIEAAIAGHGHDRVERILDAALALEQYIDVNKPLVRPPYPEWIEPRPASPIEDAFRTRFDALPGAHHAPAAVPERSRAPLPPTPEADLLWFIARHAPDLEDWERDIFLAVREESFYFYPLFACQIMNEGWASFWHARLLREADFLPHDLYLDAIRAHAGVVSPYAADDQVTLAINPYHLGFRIWERIVEQQGLEAAFRIRADEVDFSFIRNHLDRELVESLRLFAYTRGRERGGECLHIEQMDLDRIREGFLAPKFNYGAPRIRASAMLPDGSLQLAHDAATDGRGLDLDRAEKVLGYVQRIWRRPVRLETVNAQASDISLTAG